MSLTEAEKRLAATIGFELDVCEVVSQITGKTFNRLMALNADYESEEIDGLSIAVDRDEVTPILAKLQPKLTLNNYMAFWSELNESNGLTIGEEVAILKTIDPYSIIVMRRTDGANYGVTTQDVIERLKDWERRCQIQIVGAASSWVAVQFETLPENLCKFAEEIYDFCPDTVHQGVGLMNEAEDPEMFEAARQFCPEMSHEMQRKLDQKAAEFELMDIPDELRAVFKSGGGGFTTSTAMGIRLLAYSLKESKELFLWWD